MWENLTSWILNTLIQSAQQQRLAIILQFFMQQKVYTYMQSTLSLETL